MSPDFREIIAKRRDGLVNTRTELVFLANGAASGSLPDYQLASWLMAATLRPLGLEETIDLTVAMADTGTRLDLSSLPSPHLDKHSTGGVGDKTTLVLLPVLAACGLRMVKMSGSGLGITGGTTDKLKSIPGVKLDLTPSAMIEQAREIGLALSEQTSDLAPADKALYSLRDATATTDSIPLIVSSILAKKIAGGAEFVSLDIKCGSGGFMPNLIEANRLKNALVEVGTRCGLKVIAHISDMSQPLGCSVGNALEITEAFRVLAGKPLSAPSQRFLELCIFLASAALVAVGSIPNQEEARVRVLKALYSGEALRKAESWITAQGGPAGVDQIEWSLPRAKFQVPVTAEKDGYLHRLDARTVGEIVVELGGGRKRKSDPIDPSVGITIGKVVSMEVHKSETLAVVHSNSNALALRVVEKLREAFTINTDKIEPTPLIFDETHDSSSPERRLR